MSMLAAAFLCSCSNEEEPAVAGRGEAMQVSAGIGEATRAVIDADYATDLEVSFARLDDPGSNDDWTTPAIEATRAGGSGNTAITFATTQAYSPENGESVLIGYYPRKALEAGTTNPVSVKYIITGDEDIMATEIQTGALNKKFTSFTFRHLLTQLQFKCTGSAEAIAKWTAISSIKVKNVATSLTLALDETDGATLTATGSTDQILDVKNCPTAVSAADAENPTTGYLMLYPVANMGTADGAISLEVSATYSGTAKTHTVVINNIEEGAKMGHSHLITLTFAEDGTIVAEAGIAEWQPGNGGSSTVTPGT